MMKRMSLPGAALWAALVALGGCDRGANATIVATNQASVPYKPVKLDATSRERFGGSGPHGMGMPGPTQPENESPQQGPQVPITWDLPSGWQVRPTNAPPMGGMKILGSFLVANNPEAACSIVIMQGTGGGLEANVNRWRGQLGATPLTPAEIDALPKRALLGTPAYVVEAEGSFGGMAGTERKPGFKLLGAICPIHDLTLFVKLTGPAALVNAEHVHFDQLCDSLRLTGGEREQGDTPEAAKGPIDPSKYAAYLVRYPFGGHRVEWWETRLEELAPGGAHADAALYQLTVERAQQNGLVVTNNNGRITVVPNPQLATTIIARLGVR